VSCGSGVLSTQVPEGYLLVACACGRWPCPTCSPQRRRRLEAELVAGKPITFFTLTWDASRPETRERARQIMGEKWKLLTARIRRRWPAAEFEWGVVVERFKNGYPHFHILCRAPYIPQPWLSDQWEKLVGARVVDIRKVKTLHGLAKYLTKYLSKSPERIGTGKRYWFSQGYRAEPDKHPARRRIKSPWFFDPEELAMIIARYQRYGLVVITRTKGSCTMTQRKPP